MRTEADRRCALERVSAPFHKTILTFVMRVMWDAFQNNRLEEACDLAQDISRMLANDGRLLRSFKGDTDFSVKAFLSRVALNVVTDHYRKIQADKETACRDRFNRRSRQQGARELAGEAVELDIASILSWIDVERLMDSDPDRRNAARNVLIQTALRRWVFVREIADFRVSP